MSDKKRVPKLRFPGFTEPWEQRKLGEVMVSLQNNTLSRADLSNETGIAKNVHYGDVLIKFGEVLDVSEENLPMISDESVLIKYKASFLQNGDVIVADTAEDSTVGKCSEIAGLNDEVVLSGLHTIPYRPIEKFASGYLGYYLNSSAYHEQLIPLMQGIKVTSISKSAMQDTKIVYPKSMEEQGKIGNYFRNLDHLITLHQRKLEHVKKMKKSMLQKMFPKKNQLYPEVRFPGFTDAWEQRKLSDVVDSVDTGKSKFDKEGSSGEYPILGSTSVIGYDDEYDYEGDFILTARVGANAGSLYRHAGKVKISDNTVFIQASQNIEFLYQLLIRFDIKRLSFGTGQPLVKASELKRLELMMPTDMEEQMRIGVYFKNLDHLITLHQRELDHLQLLKKGMLQQMFI